jgi:hypothetical protein
MNASILAPTGHLARLGRWLLANRLSGLTEPPTPTAADSILAPLFDRAREESSPLAALQKTVCIGGRSHFLPRFVLCGEVTGHQAVRVGIFGGLDACSLDTVLAIASVLDRCDREPACSRNYLLAAYPKANVEAFTANARTYEEFRRRTADRPDDEDARHFRDEIKTGHFSVLLRLRSDADASHFHAKVRGELIARRVVLPALRALSGRFPIAGELIELIRRKRFAPSASDSARTNCLLPTETRGGAIEIELHAPVILPLEERAAGLAEITVGILANYRALLSFETVP